MLRKELRFHVSNPLNIAQKINGPVHCVGTGRSDQQQTLVLRKFHHWLAREETYTKEKEKYQQLTLSESPLNAQML
jgi:hypothetical protein